MFINIIRFRESLTFVLLFIFNVCIIDFLFLMEFFICKWIPRSFSHNTRNEINNGDIMKKRPPNLIIYKLYHWPRMLQRFATKIKSLFAFGSCHRPQNQNQNNKSKNEVVYLAEGIIYATTNNTRFARSIPLLENNQWYQVRRNISDGDSKIARFFNIFSSSSLMSSTSAGCGISTVQAADNPTAMNNPLLLSPSIWRRVGNMLTPISSIFFGTSKKQLYVGQEFESLLLNVWMPRRNYYENNFKDEEEENEKSRLLPVYVFVAGGAFTFGSANQSMHDPRDFILGECVGGDDDAVFVTLNYRLGVLGFLQAIDGIEPNLGLYDIGNAFLWIKKNIAQFGGDPNNICAIGQSAGAMSLAALLVSPHVKKRHDEIFSNNNGKTEKNANNDSTLFQTVMLMSGAALHCHGPAERDTCGDIMREKIEKILLPITTGSGSSSQNPTPIDHKALLLTASLNDVITIQQLYCQHIDGLYRNCELETRFIPFNLCVDEKHDLIPIHPQIYLRRHLSPITTKTKTANDMIMNCKKVLITTTGSEYTMFAMKHQQAHVMNNDKLQMQHTLKRAKQFVAASFQIPTRDDPKVVAIASELIGCYTSLWKSHVSDYVSRMFTITTRGSAPPENTAAAAIPKKLIYNGQLWSVFCADWTFRIPAESLMMELEKMVSVRAIQRSNKKITRHESGINGRVPHLEAVQMLRIESPCDAIPVLSSPHTSDVPFLFGTLHSFPPISGHKWLTCEKRQNFSRRLQTFVKKFHETQPKEEEEEEEENVDEEKNSSGKFWTPKNYCTRGKYYRVLTLHENDDEDTNNEKKKLEYSFERSLCNEKFDEVMAALMKFRE